MILNKKKTILTIVFSNGAGSGNRTHLSSLEGWSITDIRYPHIWSERRDSNPQHPPWQGGALPLSHFRKFGADEGSRTPTPKALDPKSSASANFATSAFFWWLTGESNPGHLD